MNTSKGVQNDQISFSVFLICIILYFFKIKIFFEIHNIAELRIMFEMIYSITILKFLESMGRPNLHPPNWLAQAKIRALESVAR